ncbi:MAG: 16S rRNA (uracil(1498)-N(3))-methyltransferase [Caldicoprobacterales bacterium]|jgi:16S rRNA (uracil1498-N3)-methyltransferase|nr:16S rRNA (uracil(1498)-N(3))-methyltransferase [Clostridiales bacterium]
MHRFFVEPEQISGSTAVIAGDDAHHIQNVLRLHIGEEIILCNGRGTDYRAVIQSMGKEQVRTELLSSEPSGTEPVTKVTLLQALPKASKMETVIQKCVELGMYELIPISTVRTVVRLANARDGEKKRIRWQRISEEAAKQSGRGIIPQIHTPVSFEETVAHLKSDLKIILWEEERENSLRKVLQGLIDRPASVAMLIGPEGGLDQKEADLARQHGWTTVSLGSRILRTETAGMAALAAIMYQLEELE